MSSPLCDPLHLVKNVRKRLDLVYPAVKTINVNNYQYGETDIQIYAPDVTKTLATDGAFSVVLANPTSIRGVNFKIRVMSCLTTNIIISSATPCITFNYPTNGTVSAGVSSFTVPVSSIGDEILVNNQGDQWYVTLVAFNGGTLYVANTTDSALTVPVQCIGALSNIVVQKMTSDLNLSLANYAVGRSALCKIIVQNVVGTCNLTLSGTFGDAGTGYLNYSVARLGVTPGIARSTSKKSVTLVGVMSGTIITVAIVNGKAYINGSVTAPSITHTA